MKHTIAANHRKPALAIVKRGETYHWRRMINGQIFTRSTRTSDKRLAGQLIAQWEADALKEVLVDGRKPVLVHAAIEAFLRTRKGTGGYANAGIHMSWWKQLPKKPLKAVELHELQAIVAARREAGAAQNTLAVTIGYWNALINFSVAQGWAGGIKLPSIKKARTRLRFLSEDEEAKLLHAINPGGSYRGRNAIKDRQRADNADLFLALMHTGARLTEVTRLTWSQVHFAQNSLHIRRLKGGTDTLLQMSTRLRAMLERRRGEAVNDSVFPTKISSSNNYKWFDNALVRAGISEASGRITPHTCRHTFASRMLQNGLSILEVKELLGHRNLASTAVYLHLNPTQAAKRAAEIFDAQ